MNWLTRLLNRNRPETDRASIGIMGEREAERLLKAKGFRVLARNWRKGKDEIDLVCLDGESLVFVETRTRSSEALVTGYHSITDRKKRALRRVCEAYLYQLKKPARTVRFDVMEVEHSGGAVGESRHYEDVPLFSKSLNRGK